MLLLHLWQQHPQLRWLFSIPLSFRQFRVQQSTLVLPHLRSFFPTHKLFLLSSPVRCNACFVFPSLLRVRKLYSGPKPEQRNETRRVLFKLAAAARVFTNHRGQHCPALNTTTMLLLTLPPAFCFPSPAGCLPLYHNSSRDLSCHVACVASKRVASSTNDSSLPFTIYADFPPVVGVAKKLLKMS